MLSRAALTQLLRDSTLTTVAFAIALGWSLFQVAEGLATFIVTLTGNYQSDRIALYPNFPGFGGALVWEVGGRVIFLSPLLAGLIEFVVVLLVALAVRRATVVRDA